MVSPYCSILSGLFLTIFWQMQASKCCLLAEIQSFYLAQWVVFNGYLTCFSAHEATYYYHNGETWKFGKVEELKVEKHENLLYCTTCGQVWPLTHFFLFPLCKRLIYPLSGKHYSLPFLPATPSPRSRTRCPLFGPPPQFN